MDLGDWRRGVGLERYEPAFRENEINEKVLPSLTAEDLKDLGVVIVGHRRVLLDAIRPRRASQVTSLTELSRPGGTPEACRRELLDAWAAGLPVLV